MFEFLKKKISGFTEKIKDRIEKKQEEPKKEIQKPISQPIQPEKELIIEKPKQENLQKIKETSQKPKEIAEEIKKSKIEESEIETKELEINEIEEQETEENDIEEYEEESLAEEALKEIQREALAKKEIEPTNEEIEIEPEEQEETEEEIIFEKKIETPKKVEEDKRELKAKVGLGKRLFGFVSGKVKITEKDTEGFFDEFELSLLESDVEQETSEAIVKQLKEQLIGKEISSREDVTEILKTEIKKALAKIMETEQINLLSQKQKPFKIMFLGPNGAGKTTTIAKIANYLLENRKSVVLAAGDTFRAAAIDQIEIHAKKLGVKLVKHNYGSDPAAVAFDAIKTAEAKSIDFVLVDTAGRQDTNKNLLAELKKIDRVMKPDLKIYVGEAYTGQALLQQAKEFNEAIGIDGFVLTKIDADAKGGTAISLLYTLKKPILFVGTGQEYKDILEFKPEFITDRII